MTTSPFPARTLPSRLLASGYLVPALCAAYFAALAVWRPEIASTRNLRLLLLDMLPLLAVAVGQTVVVIAGGIDLSVTAVISLASVAGAKLVTSDDGLLSGSPIGVPIATAAMAGVGLAAGAVHGVSVAWLGMPPFLVTLASLMALGGATVWWTGAESVSGLPEGLIALGYGDVAGVPWALVIAGCLTAAVAFALRATMFGRWLYAAGQNARASEVSGVPVRRVTAGAYALCGFCAAIAAVLYMARLETGRAELVPKELLLDCVGAVVLGGASLFGGRGTIAGTALGVLFITLVGNSLTLLDLDYWHVLMVKGGLILLAAVLDVLRHRGAT